METTLEIDGASYLVNSNVHDTYLARVGPVFEPNTVRLFKELVDADDIVADIGGNIGLTALLFSRLARHVFVFEPCRSTFEILEINLARGALENLTALNLGLGELCEERVIAFDEFDRANAHIADAHTSDAHLAAGLRSEIVQMDSLDNFFSSRDIFPDFIKIDVEGFEMDVLVGGKDLIERHRPRVALELNHAALNEFHRTSVPDYFDFLRATFPFLYAIDGDTGTIEDLHDEAPSGRVIHQHIMRNRFRDLVGGFSPELLLRLNKAATQQRSAGAGNVMSIKTPAVTSPLGTMRVVLPINTAKCSETFLVEVEISNESNCVWCEYGYRPVCLSYHWTDLHGTSIIFDGDRSALDTGDVHPGATVSASLSVVAPESPGEFRLMVTLVQEHVCWFENEGFTPVEIRVSVT